MRLFRRKIYGWEATGRSDEFQQVTEGIAAIYAGNSQLVGNGFVHFGATQFNNLRQRFFNDFNLEAQVPDTVITGIE